MSADETEVPQTIDYRKLANGDTEPERDPDAIVKLRAVCEDCGLAFRADPDGRGQLEGLGRAHIQNTRCEDVSYYRVRADGEEVSLA